MIKSFLFAGLLTLTASMSFANEAQENFKICAAQDSSWMSRFGQYVVAYDLNQAYHICLKKAWPQRNITAKRTGCQVDGHFVIAGFYCQSI